MTFNKDLINQIKDLNPIEDVVQQFMDENNAPLEHKGSAIFAHHHIWRPVAGMGTALCVTPANQMFYCFSCKQGGDVITLVQSFLFGETFEQRNPMQFETALKWLADRSGISYDPVEEMDPELFELHIINSIYGDFVEFCWKNSYNLEGEVGAERKAKVIRFIQERYPLSWESIEKFRLCYFDRAWTSFFFENMLTKYTKSELLSTGLFKEWNGNISCTFQNRIIIPYLQKGSVVYMVGRETVESSWVNQDGDKVVFDGGGKFKKIPIFNQHKEYTHDISKLVRNDYIFGYDYIKKNQEIIITEGIGDCLVLLQNGYNSCSPVTTSFKNEMLEPVASKLATTRQIYICNDNEISQGGDKGAIRMHQFFNGKGLDAKIVDLPRPDNVNKIDVADYFRNHSTDDFHKLLDSSKSIIEKQLEQVTPKTHKKDLEKIWSDILNMQTFEQTIYKEILKNKLKVTLKQLNDMFGSKKQGPITTNLVFESDEVIVPGQDFILEEDGTRTAYLTQWIKSQETDADGNVTTERVPHLITVEVKVDGERTFNIRNLKKDPLSDMEMRRIPDETVAGRWRPEEKFSFSMGSFLKAIPNPVKPEVDAVFHQIYKLYDDYVWYPQEHEKLIQTLYVMMTYFFQMFGGLPLLHFSGQKDSGKTSAMKICAFLGFNGVLIVSATPAFLFRSAHNKRSTIIIDEAEKMTGDEASESKQQILEVLRGRYKRGTGVARMVNINNEQKEVLFDCFGPTLLGSINPLEDALASRSIIIPAFKKESNIPIKNFYDDDVEIECKPIRDKLHTLMLLEFQTVMRCQEFMKQDPRIKHIINREREKWLPLFTIAHWIDISSKHTNKNLVDELVKVQVVKEQLRKDAESAGNFELIVLEIMLDVLTNKTLRNQNFKLLELGDGRLGVPADEFYKLLNARLQSRQMIKQYDMHFRKTFENLLVKSGVWGAGEGGTDAGGRIQIDTKRLAVAIKRIKSG